ncbi:Intradiol ring-cleavage dioxygenase [Hyaloraphidium curvatum]|nr:Intradiol ring-cleavage dioxygenase [Hyaloraphidium curvatum]
MRPAALLAGLLALFAAPALAHPGHHDAVDTAALARRAPVRCGKRQLGCVLAPEMTEGPYYYSQDAVPVRANITEDRTGIPVRLSVTVVDVTTCNPVANAAVDIWHCDAAGTYSHYTSGNARVTDGTTFLRGIQLTDAEGKAEVVSVFPGWYNGRTTHIHLKVHLDGTISSDGTRYVGGSVPHTGQLFFPENTTDAVYALAPYSSRDGTRMLLTQDGIYNQGGSYGLLTVSGSPGSDGFTGSVTVGIEGGGTGATVTTAAAAATSTSASRAATSTAAASAASSTTSRATSTQVPSGAGRKEIGAALGIVAAAAMML